VVARHPFQAVPEGMEPMLRPPGYRLM
jgi:hypothetical protein